MVILYDFYKIFCYNNQTNLIKFYLKSVYKLDNYGQETNRKYRNY